MVETGATGRPFPGWKDVTEDIVPAADDTYDLGSATKRWAAIFAVLLAIGTSITIGGVVKIYTTGTTLLINESTQIEGDLDIDGWITSSNWTNVSVTESQISDLQAYLTSESDPLWTGNQSSYSTTASILGWNYWNDTYATFNKTYADTLYLTSFTELDPKWTGNSTLVPYLASANVFTANQNLTAVNISAMDCIIFDSGGKICSGV